MIAIYGVRIASTAERIGVSIVRGITPSVRTTSQIEASTGVKVALIVMPIGVRIATSTMQTDAIDAQIT